MVFESAQSKWKNGIGRIEKKKSCLCDRNTEIKIDKKKDSTKDNTVRLT